MTKIAIIRYGKMGHIIERIALQRGDTITCRIDKDNLSDFDTEEFRNSDVAIEFTTPATAAANIERCFKADVPVVCGTTGWISLPAPEDPSMTMLDFFRREAEEGRGTLMWASNFSIGVNVFMALNSYLARIMNRLPQYVPSLVETHHIHKLDHPSGTAVTLAEEIVEETGRISGWKEPAEGKLGENDLPVSFIRRGEVPGIHTIEWDSPVDSITITHSAKSREGFALGAVMAAEWLSGRKGWHPLSEMMESIIG